LPAKGKPRAQAGMNKRVNKGGPRMVAQTEPHINGTCLGGMMILSSSHDSHEQPVYGLASGGVSLPVAQNVAGTTKQKLIAVFNS
jgi:hypothetical protein